MPLIDRLEAYDEGWRELEQSQLDTIRAASADERTEALTKAGMRLESVYTLMDAKEEYRARCLIDPSDQGRYKAAEELLVRAPGWFDDEDPVFDSLLSLPPQRRREFYDNQRCRADDPG